MRLSFDTAGRTIRFLPSEEENLTGDYDEILQVEDRAEIGCLLLACLAMFLLSASPSNLPIFMPLFVLAAMLRLIRLKKENAAEISLAVTLGSSVFWGILTKSASWLYLVQATGIWIIMIVLFTAFSDGT